jgi:ribosomal biogenesis protein LAS1
MAAPISVLCGKMGIAGWLVDIRHEASHNALPTLGALRLAASTLLEFLKSEYWIPTCPNWKDETANDENTEDPLQPLQQAIDYLLQYKSCASTVSSSTESASSNSNNTNSSGSTKRKQKMSKPAATTRPVDTFFGDSDSCSSSDDDDGDDWEDPLLGNVLGSSMGTNINRFAVLEPPKATKKQETKTKAPKNKKQPGERYPIDYAKDFVRAVAPQEGVSTALTFLVWGGIGGAPAGRGVLIPGSAVAFPASQQGIMKCWQRYSPLIEVLGRAWPGFCSTLLVHLVDFVLSIEDTVVQQSTVDAGSARKLYFLSAWIRLLLSQLFTAKLDPEFISKSSKTKGTKTELVLAQLSHLQKLEYPLNSLCDRCIERDDSNELRKTSRAVLHSLEEILGAKRVPNFGIRHIKAPVAIIDNSTVQEGPRPLISSEQMLSEQQEASTFSPDKTEAHTSPAASACKMSLHDIEAMLSDDEPQLTEGDISTNEAVDERKNGVNGSLPQATQKRPAWIRCASWDPCSIGTLPGYPV